MSERFGDDEHARGVQRRARQALADAARIGPLTQR